MGMSTCIKLSHIAVLFFLRPPRSLCDWFGWSICLLARLLRSYGRICMIFFLIIYKRSVSDIVTGEYILGGIHFLKVR